MRHRNPLQSIKQETTINSDLDIVKSQIITLNQSQPRNGYALTNEEEQYKPSHKPQRNSANRLNPIKINQTTKLFYQSRRQSLNKQKPSKEFSTIPIKLIDMDSLPSVTCDLVTTEIKKIRKKAIRAAKTEYKTSEEVLVMKGAQIQRNQEISKPLCKKLNCAKKEHPLCTNMRCKRSIECGNFPKKIIGNFWEYGCSNEDNTDMYASGFIGYLLYKHRYYQKRYGNE